MIIFYERVGVVNALDFVVVGVVNAVDFVVFGAVAEVSCTDVDVSTVI